MSESRSKTRTIAYLALYVALYVVLKYVGNLIPILQMPNGGSIELELIAVFICSYQLGWKLGICCGLLSWLITIVLGFEMWFVQPIQVLLDYVLPLVLCGMASFLWPFKKLPKTVYVLMGLALALAAYFGIVNSWGPSAGSDVPAASKKLVDAVSVLVAIGIFAFTVWYGETRKRFGIAISMILKYVCQMLSGVYFWFPDGSAAGSREAWIFSAGYNLWYNLVTMIVCMFVVPMLIDRLEKAHVKFVA